MADKKISELNSLTGANAANGDLVAIVDVSATETKKITRSEFFKSVPSIDGGIVFNETGADVDFRIESDTNANAFFLQGSDGYVGIGDSAPPSILSVRGNTPESRITNTNAISDTGGTEEVARLGVYGQKNGLYGPAANIVFRQDASTWSSVDQYTKGTRIEFCTQDATATDTSETPRMVIDKDGNVGIGTSNPTEKLHISQDSSFAIQMERTGASPSVCEIQNGGSFLNISNNATGIAFLTGVTPTETMRIDSSGHAIIPGGVTLGTAAGTYNAANTLDDYEEGTWTPVPQDTSGNSGTASSALGNYTKVGNLVYLNFYLEDIDTTGLTAGQDLRITGLPFSSKSVAGVQFYLGNLRLNNVAFEGNLGLGILDSTDYIRIFESITGAASDFIMVSDVTSGSGRIWGTIMYMS